MSIADDLARKRWGWMKDAPDDPRPVHVSGIISSLWAYMYQEPEGGKILGYSDDSHCMTGDADRRNLPPEKWVRFPNAIVDESAWD